MKSRGRSRGQMVTTTPVEDSSSMKPVLIICAVLLVFSVWLRYSIFGFGYGPVVTAKSYDKPVKLQRLILPKDALPPGYFFEETKVFKQPAEQQEVLKRYELSSRKCKEIIVGIFKGENQTFAQLVIDFATEDEAKSYVPHLRIQDTRAIILARPSAQLGGPLERAIGKHIDKEKKLRMKIAKLRTAGNASFCFLMDLLVGAFFFVLALFLAKYFLIVRNLEE